MKTSFCVWISLILAYTTCMVIPQGRGKEFLSDSCFNISFDESYSIRSMCNL